MQASLFKAHFCSAVMRGVSLLLLAGFAQACAWLPVGRPPSPHLRVENTGSIDIKNLAVLFPGPSAEAEATQIAFGDVPAGKATEYRLVPGGVYRYAAYEYELDGRPVQQAVVDWVGEKPIQGGKFTYRILLDTSQPPGGQIQLITVTVDEP